MGPGFAILGAVAALSGAAPAYCPADIPVQAITVVNQAHASPLRLARVERAVTQQSIQLRAAWGTPCVRFTSSGGWPLYLRIGATVHGVHYDAPTRMEVYTGGFTAAAWSEAFSHETIEALNRNQGAEYYRDGTIQQREVADPVNERGYRIRGVWVSDFVLPAWYAGATTGADIACDGDGCVDNSPMIAAADAAGPYDQMNVLSGPWQTQWERANPS